ncbi:MAG TPA: zf-HC2 domain-containing protein [Verrucomicrobiae bacterium]|jgi:putative zinc finger protein|nr:zf-HC2 domain-containing protein [Verrucomicrobiae bacterium]
MTCAENREQHSALLDGELPAVARARVEAHLAGCAECSAELARLTRMLGMLHTLPAERAPVGFVDRVLAAARPTPWYVRAWRAGTQPWRLKLPLEAAAVVIVALGAVYVFQKTPELQQAARYAAPAPSSTPAPPPTPSAPAPSLTTTPAPVPTKPAPAAPAMSDERGRAKKAIPPPAQESDRTQPSAPAPAAAPPSVAPSRDASRVDSKIESLERQSAAPAPRAEEAAKPSGNAVEPLAKESGAKDKLATRESESSGQKKSDGARMDTQATPAVPRRQRLGSRAPEVTRALVPPDASGRLSVSDREAAERALVDLRGRLDVVEAFRRDAGEGQVLIEMIVPRAALADFTRGLEGIGRWSWDRDPSTLPPQIRLHILLAR